jgi:hypothetical protein
MRPTRRYCWAIPVGLFPAIQAGSIARLSRFAESSGDDIGNPFANDPLDAHIRCALVRTVVCRAVRVYVVGHDDTEIDPVCGSWD